MKCVARKWSSIHHMRATSKTVKWDFRDFQVKSTIKLQPLPTSICVLLNSYFTVRFIYYFSICPIFCQWDWHFSLFSYAYVIWHWIIWATSVTRIQQQWINTTQHRLIWWDCKQGPLNTQQNRDVFLFTYSKFIQLCLKRRGDIFPIIMATFNSRLLLPSCCLHHW